MLPELAEQFSAQIQTFYYLLLLINGVLHIIFAGAVARDAGNLYKIGQRPALVSAPSWAFATLIGGVITAAIYWFIHHSTLTRPYNRERNYERIPDQYDKRP
ncbi:hypothetical protein [Legionella londiniensis]|uniref:Transmembrane protein n=1 Tax=Legionella londiniensis TaxID=45068 RepID=A0A0W0VSG3_9GAMM|nr:hypothetical protein [Legionella londiniensis]KTD22965.1 hypothetical protein Llon_0355 [Legionella londiniensis]STX92927.1 Uncharacterised protein [Legionella londiniensis]